MTYKIYESAGAFQVYRIDYYGNMTSVKFFKTRKAAENWVKKHS